MIDSVLEVFFEIQAYRGTVPAIVFFLVIAGFIYFLFHLIQCLRSYQWPHVDGVVVVSKLNRRKQSTTNSSGNAVFQPVIHYEYNVAGNDYHGKKIRFFQLETSFKQAAQKSVDTFPKGAAINVYHNPRKPSSSVLVKGVSGGAWFLLGWFCLSLWLLRVTLFK